MNEGGGLGVHEAAHGVMVEAHVLLDDGWGRHVGLVERPQPLWEEDGWFL